MTTPPPYYTSAPMMTVTSTVAGPEWSSCSECGALVPHMQQYLHDAWHLKLVEQSHSGEYEKFKQQMISMGLGSLFVGSPSSIET